MTSKVQALGIEIGTCDELEWIDEGFQCSNFKPISEVTNAPEGEFVYFVLTAGKWMQYSPGGEVLKEGSGILKQLEGN